MALLPDADALLLAAVKDALPGLSVGTQIPQDLLTRLPFARIVRFGGQSVHPLALDRASVSVDVWAASRKVASDNAAAIRDALYVSAVNQTVYPPHGHIVTFREIAAPSELRVPDQADDLWRFTATYSLYIRPAAA